MAGEILTGAAQENLLAMLAHSNEHGRIIAGMLDPQLFEGDYKLVAERLLEFWQNHNAAPEGHSYDLFADIIEDRKNRKGQTFKHILDQMAELSEAGVNANYVINTLQQFSRLQKLKASIYRAAEMLNKPGPTTITQTETLLYEIARARDFHFNPGTRLDDIEKFLSHFENVASEFNSGVKLLDQNHIGPFRGGLLTFLAPSGYGKSWFLVNIGKAAMMQRKRVLHISLENSEPETMMRYYQALFAVPKRFASAEIEIPQLVYDRDGKFSSVDLEKVSPTFTFESPAIRDELQTRVKLFYERMMKYLVIRRFPTRGLSVEGLAAYIDGLEATERFTPDLLIVDYPGIMKTDVKNHRLSLGRVFEDLRGLLVERNIAGAVAHQTSKKAMNARRTTVSDAGEDFTVIQTSDIALTFSATEAERRRGLARMFVDKSRQEKDHWGMLITQAYAIGQFCLDSTMLPREYYQYLERMGSARDDDDEPDNDDDDDAEGDDE